MTDRYTAEELRGLYGEVYVQAFSTQSLRRIGRLLPYFELESTDVVADFACGNGMLLDALHGKVSNYIGVDFSEAFIAKAKCRFQGGATSNAIFVCEDIAQFCERYPSHFDKAFTLDFSEHIYDADFVTIFSSIRQALRPGGKLFLHTPNAMFFLEALKNRGWLPQVAGHIAVRSACQYQALLQQAGFSLICVRYLPHYLPILGLLHGLSRLPVLGKYFEARLFITCTKTD